MTRVSRTPDPALRGASTGGPEVVIRRIAVAAGGSMRPGSSAMQPCRASIPPGATWHSAPHNGTQPPITGSRSAMPARTSRSSRQRGCRVAQRDLRIRRYTPSTAAWRTIAGRRTLPISSTGTAAPSIKAIPSTVLTGSTRRNDTSSFVTLSRLRMGAGRCQQLRCLDFRREHWPHALQQQRWKRRRAGRGRHGYSCGRAGRKRPPGDSWTASTRTRPTDSRRCRRLSTKHANTIPAAMCFTAATAHDRRNALLAGAAWPGTSQCAGIA